MLLSRDKGDEEEEEEGDGDGDEDDGEVNESAVDGRSSGVSFRDVSEYTGVFVSLKIGVLGRSFVGDPDFLTPSPSPDFLTSSPDKPSPSSSASSSPSEGVGEALLMVVDG